MNPFRYIANVLTGRFAHWNTANNQTIADLWERSSRFPDPVRIPFQDFIVCSSLVTDRLLGPQRGRARLIRKDPLTISRHQFFKIHSVILECFAGMFLQLNPSFSESFKGALAILTGCNPDESRVIQLTERLPRPDVMKVAALAWEELIAVTDSKQATSFLENYAFAALLGSLAVESAKNIRGKLEP